MTWIDPDGNSWFLSDLDMAEGFICEDITGLSGIPVQMTSVPLVQGGAIAQILNYQLRQIILTVFVMSVDGAVGQTDYLNFLDAFTRAFTTIRDLQPSPGTLIVQRPDGSQRQVTAYVTAGVDQPNDSTDISGLLFTTYVITLQAMDPFFYDLVSENFLFESAATTVVLETIDFEDGVDGYQAGGTGAAVAQSTDFASTGTHSLKLTGDGTHADPQAFGPLMAVAPGQHISVSVDFDASASCPDTGYGFNAYAPDGVTFVTAGDAATFTLAATTKTTKTYTYDVPADGSVGFVSFFYGMFTTPASSLKLYADNIVFSNQVGILPILPIALQGATDLGDVTVTNSGTEDSYPTWVITGPGTPVMTNNTTGKSWGLSDALGDTDVLTVVTLPGQQSATLGDGTNWWDKITATTPADLWALVPGDNDVDVAVSSGGTGTEVELLMTRRWGRA
jgi:hypothetical protein